MRSLVVLALAVALPACTAKSPAPAPVPAPAPAPARTDEVADGQHLTEFQLTRLLGHYSTVDGKSGFILDRTQEPPLARLDGDEAIRPLTRRGSVYGAYELASDDKSIWLRIAEESGQVLLFQGPQQTAGVEVVRDADAERLK
jgi:hypothetical protein